MDFSQLHADSVRSQLLDLSCFAPELLISVGLGESDLRFPSNPVGEEIRPMQIVLLSI